MISELAKSGFVLAVTGLQAEARIALRSPRTRAIAGGGDAAQLERLIAQAMTVECCGIISFGTAGALRPDLSPGACLVGREVMHETDRYRVDAAWTARLQSKLGAAESVAIAGVERPLVASTQKQALFEQSGAAAVDMESYVAARLAAKHGVPFAVLRVVADPQERTLPEAALVGMRADGTTDVAAVLGSLGKNPGQIPQLLRVAADAFHAYSALLRCHRRLGPGLGFFDLG